MSYRIRQVVEAAILAGLTGCSLDTRPILSNDVGPVAQAPGEGPFDALREPQERTPASVPTVPDPPIPDPEPMAGAAGMGAPMMDPPQGGAGEPSASGDQDEAEPPPSDTTRPEDDADASDDPVADPDASDDDTTRDEDEDDWVSEPCGGDGETVVVETTIVVEAGERFNGRCRRYVGATALLASAPGAEGASPLFELRDGARLANVFVGVPAADGVYTYGDATLENIHFQRVGDDALTIKEAGTVEVDGGSAENASNTVFQINAPGTLRVSAFVARDIGKLIRQDGGTRFRVDALIEGCTIRNVAEAIFRTDSRSSTVTMTDTSYSGVQGQLFMGVSPDNINTTDNRPF